MSLLQMPYESSHFFARHVAIQRNFLDLKERFHYMKPLDFRRVCLMLYADWLQLTIDSVEYKNNFKGLAVLSFTNIAWLFYRYNLMLSSHQEHEVLKPSKFLRWKYKTFGSKKNKLSENQALLLHQYIVTEIWKSETETCPTCLSTALSDMEIDLTVDSIVALLPK